METILILEKRNTLRILLQEELEGEGYHILFAESDKDALKKLQEYDLDLIVADYYVPPTELYLTMLHEADKNKGVPVLIHTAYPCELIDFNAYGPIECLSKRSDLTMLKSKIKEMLRSRKHLTTTRQISQD